MAGTAPRRSCTTCDRRFRTPIGMPDEERCSSCRSGSTVRALPVQPEQPTPGEDPTSVRATTRATLVGAGRDGTPLGVVALKLAAELDEAKGVAAARISTEWAKVFAQAMEGADAEVDVVDQIFGATGS